MKPLKYRLEQLYDILTIPGILSARRAGIIFDSYKMIYKLKQAGISPKSVIDIGASVGMFAKTVNYFYKDAEIFSFEPLKRSYKKLSEEASACGNIHPFNFALGESNEEITINESEYEYSSSILNMAALHKEAYPYSAESKPLPVKKFRLDDIKEQITLNKPVLMKLDVQGYELKVLEGAKETLQQTDYILIEMSFHELYEKQPLFDEVYKYLTEKGFKLIDILNLSRHPNTSELLQLDAVFSSPRAMLVPQ